EGDQSQIRGRRENRDDDQEGDDSDEDDPTPLGPRRWNNARIRPRDRRLHDQGVSFLRPLSIARTTINRMKLSAPRPTAPSSPVVRPAVDTVPVEEETVTVIEAETTGLMGVWSLFTSCSAIVWLPPLKPVTRTVSTFATSWL